MIHLFLSHHNYRHVSKLNHLIIQSTMIKRKPYIFVPAYLNIPMFLEGLKIKDGMGRGGTVWQFIPRCCLGPHYSFIKPPSFILQMTLLDLYQKLFLRPQLRASFEVKGEIEKKTPTKLLTYKKQVQPKNLLDLFLSLDDDENMNSCYAPLTVPERLKCITNRLQWGGTGSHYGGGISVT